MYRLIAGMLFLLLLSACAYPHAVRHGERSGAFSFLTVEGEARVEVPPDQLQLRLNVVTSDADSEVALQQNNRKMNSLIETLQGLGLVRDDYRTGQFQTYPEWSRPPRPAPANWQRSIVGYTVNNELLIKTGQVELAGKLLAAAQAAGADQVGGLVFALAEPADHREEAIARATRRAMRKAQTLAEAAGVKLGAIQSLTLDQAAAPGPLPRMEMMAARAGEMADAVPVNAGNVEVRAGVTLVYRIVSE
ncbi:MAG: SIMPL domain-containing protein [Desulfuromonadales bacterium]|nr:SIMPL domain-containing protein [Desulfuromonadales bacterium]